MHLLQRTVLLTWAIAILLNTYLYNYTALRGCGFPTKTDAPSAPIAPASPWMRLLRKAVGQGSAPGQQAEFRLLAFADPQLEGDTSVWHARRDAPFRPAVFARRVREASSASQVLATVWEAVLDAAKTVPRQLAAWRKQLDLVGNDYYLAHVYRSMHRATQPTHVTVMGDLLGSQWIGDAEFERRAARFWQRVFQGATRVEDHVMEKRADEVLGADTRWARHIINIAGNHDVGYAGDLTQGRMDRFEHAFGAANWEMWLHGEPLEGVEDKHAMLRVVVLNSMNLDTPAKDETLQHQTYEFLNHIISTSEPVEEEGVGTVLLTHIPLHKREGVCADAPFFDFAFEGATHGMREQNHLSYDASMGVLQGIFGMNPDASAPGGGFGRPGIVLNGHDHVGCDVYHYLPPENERDLDHPWNATRWADAAAEVAADLPGMREVTMRSMMGEFGGYAYMVSAWFDQGARQWRFEVDRCGMGVQHWWWAAHITALLAVLLTGLYLVVEQRTRERRAKKPGATKKHK